MSSTIDPNSSSFWTSREVRRDKVDVLFILTTLLIGKVLLLRVIRHRKAWGFVTFLFTAAGYLSHSATNYVLGHLDDAEIVTQLMLMWAVFLVVLEGAVDTTTSQSLEDNEAIRKRMLWDKLLPSLWLFMVVFLTNIVKTFWIPMILLWVLFILKLKEKKLALIYACRSRLGLDRVTTIIAEYMKGECTPSDHSKSRDGEEGLIHTSTIQDYRYLVGVKEALKRASLSVYPPKHTKELHPNDLTTIDEIWQCEGKLLCSEDTDWHLKDTCLSFALFWRLLPMFAEHELPDASGDKPWKFVRDVLLTKDKKEVGYQRVFRVLELELQFLRDYFYTNYFAIYCSGGWFLLIRVIVLACYLQVSFITLEKIKMVKQNEGPMHWYEADNLQYSITKLIIYSLSVVEFVHIVNMITSRWNKMKWVCSYVRNKWWKSNLLWLGKVKEWFLCQLCHQPLFRPFFRTWHRELHQYSLLDSYKHTPFKLRFRWVLEGYIELPMIGQKESSPTSLSTYIMEAVLLSLRRDIDGPKLSNGLESLCRNKVEDKLSWACISSKITRVILVWHIATSMCEKDRTKASCCAPLSYCGSSPEDPNFLIATSLSKYCAYLVAFVPKLLPDHVYYTQCIFEQAVSDAREEFKPQCCNIFKAVMKFIIKMGGGQNTSSGKVSAGGLEQGNPPCIDEGGNLMEMGLYLAEQLKQLEDESVRWKVLADFWVELILFLAPSKNPNEHGKHLVNGGQFITHLWVLLIHAGIIGRDGL